MSSWQQNVIDIIDPNTSDVDIDSGSDDEDETYVPPRIPADESSDDSFSSADEDPLANIAAPKKKSAPKRPIYCWRKKQFDPPNTCFTGEGISAPAYAKVGSPFEYFQKFITDEMSTLLVQNTNLCSVQKDGKSVETSKKELEQVFGIYFRMGIVQMPGVRVYCEQNTRYAPVADVISRKVSKSTYNHAFCRQYKGHRWWKIW